ncbi:hypothetical protein [Nocardia sp. NPDC050717]|uniref:hypothetical protein n=1 Tax=Nocardia sp. NPDC050717 TaxID=3157221 RepID=UPI0033F428C9
MLEFLRKYGLLGPAGRLLVALVALVVGIAAIVWIGNPHISEGQQTASPVWTNEELPEPETTVVPPPSGFPYMEFPPPMPPARNGLQEVPTRFGLSYSVPDSENWMATNDMVFGFTGPGRSPITFGAGSRFSRGYCSGDESAVTAYVGLTGRNGVSLDAAAREAVVGAEWVYSNSERKKPRMSISGPFESVVSGLPAIRYSAQLSEIPEDGPCTPREATYEIVATRGYANAEVAIFMLARNAEGESLLPTGIAEMIVGSLRKTGA